MPPSVLRKKKFTVGIKHYSVVGKTKEVKVQQQIREKSSRRLDVG